MEEQSKETKQITRRQALITGAGAVGTLTALTTGVLPALAHQAQMATHHTTLANGAPPDDEWKRVAAVFGKKGKIEPGDVLMIDLPRKDLSVTLSGIPVKPEFGVETEITFQHVGNEAVVKVEMALLDQEVIPVMTSLLDQGFLITALHTHFLNDSPVIRFMHGTARGSAVQLAQAIRRALSRSGTPFGGPEEPGQPGFDVHRVEDILGGQGELSNGVLTVMVERKEMFRENGIMLKPAMQLESMILFQSIGGNKAATGGELIVLPGEARAVSRELRARGLFITALHNHELDIQPHIYWLHFFGTGSVYQLAGDVRAALNHTNSKFK